MPRQQTSKSCLRTTTSGKPHRKHSASSSSSSSLSPPRKKKSHKRGAPCARKCCKPVPTPLRTPVADHLVILSSAAGTSTLIITGSELALNDVVTVTVGQSPFAATVTKVVAGGTVEYITIPFGPIAGGTALLVTVTDPCNPGSPSSTVIAANVPPP